MIYGGMAALMIFRGFLIVSVILNAVLILVLWGQPDCVRDPLAYKLEALQELNAARHKAAFAFEKRR